MKLRLVNLTYFGFYIDLFGATGCVTDPDKITFRFTSDELKELKDAIAKQEDMFLLYAFLEPWSPNAINIVLELLGVTPNQANVILLLDKLVLNKTTIARKLVEERLPKPDGSSDNDINFDKVIFYDYFAAMSGLYEDEFGSNQIINLEPRNFLFLMGKPYGSVRITLLHELYKRKLLSNSMWSFHYDEQLKEITKSRLPFLTDSEFDSFVNATARKLDNVEFRIGKDRSFFLGYPIDPLLYASSSFSIISETINWFPGFITEKTWRTISNNHAFVIASCQETVTYLESLGLDTFRYMIKTQSPAGSLEIQHYDNIVANQTEEFIERINDNKHKLEQSIRHNHAVFRSIVDDQRQIVDKILEPILKDRCYQYWAKSQYTIEGEDAKHCIAKLWC